MEKKSVDMPLSLLVILALIFGMIMISSVSVYDSYKVTTGLVNKGVLDEVSNSYYLFQTIGNVFVGFIMLAAFSKIPYQLYEKYAHYFYALGIFVLILVFIPKIGNELKGAKGWINIPGLPSIQPVEFAKLSLLIYLAYFLKKRRALIRRFKLGFIPFFMAVWWVLLPLVFQPDFWSILILTPVAFLLYFVGWWRGKYLLVSIGVAFLLATSVFLIGKMESSDGKPSKFYYISQRVENFFRPNKEIMKLDSNSKKNIHQIKQAFVALWSGGFWGLGFGNSIQKFGYLPEVQGDFIFSVIVEELWFIGGCLVIALYIFFGYRGFLIARSVDDLFGKYLATGITLWVVVQAFVNIGVNLSVIPLTGVTLPLISYGGSSILSLTIASGILLSISRHAEYRTTNLSDILQARRKVIL